MQVEVYVRRSGENHRLQLPKAESVVKPMAFGWGFWRTEYAINCDPPFAAWLITEPASARHADAGGTPDVPPRVERFTAAASQLPPPPLRFLAPLFAT